MLFSVSARQLAQSQWCCDLHERMFVIDVKCTLTTAIARINNFLIVYNNIEAVLNFVLYTLHYKFTDMSGTSLRRKLK
jgi:penicillin V acylase-like amidase (Ntn superfamily)